MSTTTKKDLIDRIAKSTQTKQALTKNIIQNFLDEIVTELSQGNRLEFRDFGVFESKTRAPRLAQNPKTMVKVKVDAKRIVKFKAGRVMKARMDEAPVNVDEATGLVIDSSSAQYAHPEQAIGDGAGRRKRQA